MSTHSSISVRHEDGTYSSIYCHFDGYLSHNGRILLDHYTDLAKVEELVALGDISVLAPNPAPTEGELHTCNFPQKDVVIAYCRDMGKGYGTVPREVLDEDGALLGEEFVYLWRDGHWYYHCDYSSGDVFLPLTQEAIDKFG